MLQAGDRVFDKTSGAYVQVIEQINVWGYSSYRVYNPETSRVYKVLEEQLSKESDSHAYDENYLRYVVMWSKIKNETAGGLLSSLSSNLIPLPHQMHVLNRVLANHSIRYILADEVGLGKTIEAGMIIKELKTRGLIKRTLVVAPTGLVTQWASEMQEKFHETFTIIMPSDFDTIRRVTDNDDVYSQFDQIITPMDSIKPLEKRAGWSEENIAKYNEERIFSIVNSGWDLIIIDEAHRVAGSSSDVARHKLAKLLAKASPYLLLLTATPHNGKTEPFLRLVRLLDDKAFPNVQSIVKEQVAPYFVRTEKREAIDNYGNKLFKNRITHFVELTWDERHSFQKDLYQFVSNYVSKTYNKALRNRKRNMCLIFLLIIMQRMVTSSTAAILKSLERRLEVLRTQSMKIGSLTEEDLSELNIEDDAEEALEAISLDVKEEIDELEWIVTIAKQAEFQHPDIKVESLLDTIDAVLVEDSAQKIIIFTEFVGTQEYLVRLLENYNYEVCYLNGSMSIEDRNIALRDFRNRANIFISTDAGGEGLNLQFANIVINYDLPWNPMKIEQRCGRADRIGQTRDVHVFNFSVTDTVENRVRQVFKDKLAIILNELGVDKYSDVLDSEVAEHTFTNLFMRSISYPNKIDKSTYLVESEIKEQITNAHKYKEIIREEKDLKALVGKEYEFDIDDALRTMLVYYSKWKGESFSLTAPINITNTTVREHLDRELLQDTQSPLLSVAIDDFPNEAGYFMLWEISTSADKAERKMIPIFINKDFILRPVAGKRILDVFLDSHSTLQVKQGSVLSLDEYHILKKMSMDYSYDSFLDLKNQQMERNLENYTKYMYAIRLRTEAAEKIGVENIKKSRLMQIYREKEVIEQNYQQGQNICPDFRLVLLVILEA